MRGVDPSGARSDCVSRVACVYRGRPEWQAPAHHHQCPPAGETEGRIQQVRQAAPPRPRAVGGRHGAGHEGRASLVSKQVRLVSCVPARSRQAPSRVRWSASAAQALELKPFEASWQKCDLVFCFGGEGILFLVTGPK